METNHTISSKRRLSIGLYLNYFIHGFGLIILAQNMQSLATSWSTTIAVVSYIMSGIGIGRLIAYPITGFLSDRLNRKLFIYLGMAGYFIFAVGMIMTNNLIIAYLLAIIAGLANSNLDAGTYTTLVEINDGNGHGTVILKAFISAGEFILPVIVLTLHQHQLWFGWAFIIMAGLILINLLNIMPLRFPQQVAPTVDQIKRYPKVNRQRKGIATVLLAFYGFTSMAVMIWFTQWITLFAQKTLHFNESTAHFLLSLYSIGSIIGVFVLYWLLKRKVSEQLLLITLNLGALVALLLVSIGQQPLVAEIGCILFGFCAAGGVMQTGLTWFMNLYPQHRGTITGIFYFFGSIASLLVPIISGWLSKTSIQIAFCSNLIIAILGFLLVLGATIVINTNTRKDDSHAN